MRLLRSVIPVAIGAAGLGSGVPACKPPSYSDYPTDDSGASADRFTSGSSSGIVADDSSVQGSDVLVIDEGNLGPPSDCAVPSGTYEVTATPVADSGASCTATTTTEVFPPPKANDAGFFCTYDPAGMLPVCGLRFECTSIEPTDAGTTQTTVIGNIQIDGTSLAGAENIAITLEPAGTTSTCGYILSFAKK